MANDCLLTSGVFQITPSVFWNNIYKIEDITWGLFVMPKLVGQYIWQHPKFTSVLQSAPKPISNTHVMLLYHSSALQDTIRHFPKPTVHFESLSSLTLVNKHFASFHILQQPWSVFHALSWTSIHLTFSICGSIPGNANCVVQKNHYMFDDNLT